MTKDEKAARARELLHKGATYAEISRAVQLAAEEVRDLDMELSIKRLGLEVKNNSDGIKSILVSQNANERSMRFYIDNVDQKRCSFQKSQATVNAFLIAVSLANLAFAVVAGARLFFGH